MKLRSRDNYQSIKIIANMSEGEYQVMLQFKPGKRFTFQYYSVEKMTKHPKPELTGNGHFSRIGTDYENPNRHRSVIFGVYTMNVDHTQCGDGKPHFYSEPFIAMAKEIHHALEWLQYGDNAHLGRLMYWNYGCDCIVYDYQDSTKVPERMAWG